MKERRGGKRGYRNDCRIRGSEADEIEALGKEREEKDV